MPDSNHTTNWAVDLSALVPPEFSRFLSDMEKQARAPKPGTEEHFRSLDVQEGDRVRLTELVPVNVYAFAGNREKKDAAVLEGIVLGIKEKDDKSLVRIKGFDHTGGNAGGQHVWFPVGNYKVEVLHRVYRITEEDKILIAISGITEKHWRSRSDSTREAYRKQWRPRVAKVKRVLGVDE